MALLAFIIKYIDSSARNFGGGLWLSSSRGGALVDRPGPPDGGPVRHHYHVCDWTALFCLVTIMAVLIIPCVAEACEAIPEPG